MESGFAEVEGGRLYYEVAGEGHPVILVHGGLVHSALWDEQFESFARRFKVIRYDAREHGRSVPAPGPFSHHRDLRGLMRVLGVERAHLVGLSMGGGISLELALEHPETVSSLTLVGAGTDDYEWSEEIIASWEEVGAAFEAGDSDLAVEATLKTWTDGPRRNPNEVDPSARERVREMTAHNFGLPDADSEEVELDPPPLSRLSEIKVPTLVILGKEDVPDILKIGEMLRSGIEGARVAEIEDAAHHLNLEKPTDFDRIALEFLEEVSG